ncbi:MAG: hypothetical protein LBB34_04745 [Holosporales bacterium]|jgi:hypothetical protein|nr:hypothetical protein [Holosporales bacterium]
MSPPLFLGDYMADGAVPNLKIAVCFFGHLRTYEKCAVSLRENLLNGYDCDLFMHTWTTLDSPTQAWHGGYYEKVPGQTNKDDIINVYGEFKGLETEEQIPVDKGEVKTKVCEQSCFSISIWGLEASFHSMHRSNKLREKYQIENNIKYDFILFVRPDILLKTRFIIQRFTEVLPQAKIERGFFTAVNAFLPIMTGPESFGSFDILFFGTPIVISDIMKNITECWRRFKQNTIIEYCQEYEMINMIIECGWQPYYMIGYRQEYEWCVLRYTSDEICATPIVDTRSCGRAIRRRVIKLRIRSRFLLWLFPATRYNVISLQCSLFGVYTIDVAIGNPGREN